MSVVTTSSPHHHPGGGPLRDEQVLDQVGMAVIASDPSGVVTTWNSRAESLYGWTREEALGRHFTELTVPDESRGLVGEIMEAIDRGETWQGAFRMRRKDGSTFSSFVKDSPIYSPDGQLIGIVCVSIEIGDPALAQAARSIVGGNNQNGQRRTRALSPREREVLALLARGLTGEQIAERLVLSAETVRTHIRNAREKLGASTRVEAVTMALVSQEIQV